jgi:hypothetical protein
MSLENVLPEKSPHQSRLEKNLSSLIHLLKSSTGVGVEFTDDPELTGCFDASQNKIVLSTAHMEKLTREQQVLLAAHETGHLADFCKDPTGWKKQIEWIHTQSAIAQKWLAKEIVEACAEKKLAVDPSVIEQLIKNECAEMCRLFWNYLDDIFVNNWATAYTGSLNKNTLATVYQDILFPESSEHPFSESPLHLQFAMSLLRDSMTGKNTDSAGESLWSPQVNQATQSPVTSKQKPVHSVVSSLNNITSSERSALVAMDTKSPFYTITQRWSVQRQDVFKKYYEFWQQDMKQKIDQNVEKLIKKLKELKQSADDKNDQENGEEAPSDSSQNGADSEQQSSSKGKSDSQKSKSQARQGSIFDDHKPQRSKQTSFIDKMIGDSKEEAEKNIDEMTKSIEEGKKELTPEGKKEAERQKINEKLAQDAGVPVETVKDYQDRVQKYNSTIKEFSDIWNRLLGEDTGESKTNVEIASKGQRLSIPSIIKNFASLHQQGVPIFEQKTQVENQEDVPLAVNIRLILDCSGSMNNEGEEALKDLYTILTHSFEVYMHRYSNTFPRPKFKVSFALSAMKYGDSTKMIRNLSSVTKKIDTIQGFSNISADMGGNNDTLPLVQTLSQIQDTQAKQMQKKAPLPLEIVFFVTDGGFGDDPIKMSRVIHTLGNVSIARGIQVAPQSGDSFSDAWDGENTQGKTIEDMSKLAAVCAGMITEILNDNLK